MVLEMMKTEIKEITRFPLMDLYLVIFLILVSLWMAFHPGRATLMVANSPSEALQMMSRKILVMSYASIEFLIAVLTSLLVALSIARDYERGRVHLILTLLPSRRWYLLSKIVSCSLPPTISAVFSFLLGLLVIFVTIPLVESIIMMCIVLLLTLFYSSLTLLLSLIAKRLIPSLVISTIVALFTNMISKTLVYFELHKIPTFSIIPPLCYRTVLTVSFNMGPNSINPYVLVPISITYIIALLLASNYYFNNIMEVGK